MTHSKEVMEIASEMAEFMKSLKCPKGLEIVQRWEELKKECPNFKCVNLECPCGEDCDCMKLNGECNCEKKFPAE